MYLHIYLHSKIAASQTRLWAFDIQRSYSSATAVGVVEDAKFWHVQKIEIDGV